MAIKPLFSEEMDEKLHQSSDKMEQDAPRGYTNVTRKLARFCDDPDLLREIRHTCVVLKQIQMEAWHIANLHLLRCIDSGIELPILDQTSFYRCCLAARVNGIRTPQPEPSQAAASVLHRAPHRSMDPGFLDSVGQYREAREEESRYVPPSTLKYAGNNMLWITAQMRVKAENIIALEFKKRLALYVRLKLKEGSTERAPTAAVLRLVRACYNVDDDDLPEDERLLREWVGYTLYKKNIKANLGHFVRKLHEIQQTVEASQRTNPDKKGVRSFSLLPYSSSYSAGHVVINGSALHGFCARLLQTTGRNPFDIELTVTGKLKSTAFVSSNKELYLRRAFAVHQFETMKPDSPITKQEFNTMDHATKAPFASRLFANQITANGYSALVLLTRPKTSLEMMMDNSIESKQRWRNKNKLSDLEWRLLPADYEADMMIGIDPGMGALCTAVSEGGVLLPRPRSRRSRRRPADLPLREFVQQVFYSMSSKEYRHLAVMKKASYWFDKLKIRNVEYAEALRTLPSFKTAEFTAYAQRLKIFWHHVNFLINFSEAHAFLKWRFFTSRQKKKALDTVAKRLVPIPSPRVLIGYGDWSSMDNIKGHPHTPVKGLRKALQKRATVVPIDEYRTSKLCSSCHGCLRRAELRTWSNLGSIDLISTRNVLRCSSGACEATLWNRDVNAARNILFLLNGKLHGEERSLPFRRPSRQDSNVR